MESLGVNFCVSSKFWKTDRGVDVIAQQFFSHRDITREKAFDGIDQKALSEAGIAFNSRLNRRSEIFC
jgi:hypothetical protein